jgi:hypothetical protein
MAKRFRSKESAVGADDVVPAGVEVVPNADAPIVSGGATDADATGAPNVPVATPDVDDVPNAPPAAADVEAKAKAAVADAETPVADVDTAAVAVDVEAGTETAAAADADADEPFEDDDAFSKVDGSLKRRRDLRDGIIALAALIAIVAAPAIGAAVQPSNQPATPVAEEPSETEPTEIVPVVEREPSFVPLAVNAVKADDTVLTGTGNPGFVVRVTFTGQERPSEATVGQDGTWRIAVPTGVSLKAGDERVLNITQDDPATSASYRPGATTPSKPPTQDNTVVANDTETDENTPEDEETELVWYDGWTEQRLVRAARDVQELVTAAWTEYREHDAVYAPIFGPDPETGELVEIGQELVTPAWIEPIEHPAEYTTVHYPAEYETIYHEGYWG